MELGTYLARKLKQLGLAAEQFSAAMDLSVTMVQVVINDYEDPKGFSDERIESLITYIAEQHQDFFDEPMSEAEKCLVRTLNDAMDKPRPRGGLREGAGKKPSSSVDTESVGILAMKNLNGSWDVER